MIGILVKPMKKKLLKILCAGIAGIILVNSVQYVVKKETLKAEAMNDTLPGVELIRDNTLSSGDTFRILEIAPDVQAAEVGFFIEGQEPFSVLSNGDGTWISWEKKLASFGTVEERTAFMNSLYAEYQTYASAYSKLLSSEDAPFTWEMADAGVAYQEYSSTVGENMEGVHTIITSSAGKRGYFQRNNEGRWVVIFRRVSNVADLNVEDVLNGVDRVYYSATSTAELKYADLFLMDYQDSNVPVYKRETGGYYSYAGTASEIWANLKESGTIKEGDYFYDEETNTVSGNAMTVSPNDTELSGYHTVDFTRITNNENNQVEVGTEIYVINSDMSYTTEMGQYDLVETAEGLAAGDQVYTNADLVYFKGGISNADFFREEVFGFETTDKSKSNFHIEVTTMTPAMLNQITEYGVSDTNADSSKIRTDYDLIYIGNGAFKDELQNNSYTGYGNVADMSYEAMRLLFSYVMDNELPVIVDAHSVFTYSSDSENPSLSLNNVNTSTSGGNSYFHSLVGLLMSPVNNKSELLSQLAVGNYYCNTFVQNYFSNNNEMVKTLEGPSSDKWDLQYVTGNVYVFNGQYSRFIDYISNYLTAFWDLDDANAVVDGGFQEVADEIVSENLYREADASAEVLDWDVTGATSLAYIIHYHNRRTSAVNMKLDVLEIQPAYIEAAYNGYRNGAKEDPGTLTKKMVADWSGVDENNITIHTMQMAEFVGKLDDLNATYDMIYIGGRTSGFEVDNQGNPVYNDPDMYGLVYSHVGDEYVIPSRMNQDGRRGNRFIGLMANERNNNGTANTNLNVTYRFSGNDLTTDKYNALMEYFWSGYPIIIGSDLLDSTGNISTLRVDNSSYLYDFLTTVKGKEKWVFTEDELGDNGTTLFRFYITRSKLSIKDVKGNAVDENGLIYATDGSIISSILQPDKYYELNNTVSEIKADSYGNYYLTFKFQIENSSGASYVSNYKVQLYVDSNADGKYSLTSEELLPLTVDKATSNTLKANTVYTVSKQLPSSFQGCISWKLVVSQVDNPYVRTSIKGYSRLLLEEGQRQPVIRICQLMFNDDASKTLNLQKVIGKWNGKYGSEAAYTNVDYTHDSGRHYNRNATDMLGSYILDITTYTANQFNNNPSVINSVDAEGRGFDMLIFGFADASANLYAGSVTEIEKFIKSGKSVLFSHDLAQYYFNPRYATSNSSSNNNAYYVTRNLRAMLGMDPYGVSRNNYSTVLASGNGMDLTQSTIDSYGLEAPTKNSSGLYSYNTYDVAYKPRSGKTSTVGQVHGLNNWFLMLLRQADDHGFRRYLTDSSYYSSWGLSTNDWGGTNGDGNNGASFATNYVQQENDGQITNYPFKITGDSEGLVKVGTTHQQWLNLDMYSDLDGDGQTDMVVWFTLSQKSGQYNTSGSGSLMLDKGDVTNNYYIYNFGNVTYTGMGHNSASNDCTTDMEAKLFLNTMVASYNTGVRVPEVGTTDNDLSTDTFYGYYDASSQTSLDSTVKIGFNFTDLNMATEKNMQIQFWTTKVNDLGELVDDENITKAMVDSGCVTTSMGDLIKSNQLVTVDGVSGFVLSGLKDTGKYYLNIPVSYLTTEGSENYVGKIKIKVRSLVTKSTSGSSITTPTEWGETTVNYISVSLFDLD